MASLSCRSGCVAGYHGVSQARQGKAAAAAVSMAKTKRERWVVGEEGAPGLRTATGSPFSILVPLPFLSSPRSYRKLSILAARSASLYPSVGNPWAHAVPPFRILVTTSGLSQKQVLRCRVWTAPLGGECGVSSRARNCAIARITRGYPREAVLEGQFGATDRAVWGAVACFVGDGLSVVDSWIPAQLPWLRGCCFAWFTPLRCSKTKQYFLYSGATATARRCSTAPHQWPVIGRPTTQHRPQDSGCTILQVAPWHRDEEWGMMR